MSGQVLAGPWGRTPVDAWRVLRQRVGWADVAHWTYGGRLDDELGGLPVFRTPCGLYRPGEDWSQPSHHSTARPRQCERCEAALRHPAGQEGPRG